MSNMKLKIAFTGHRPQKLFGSEPYSQQNFDALAEFCCFTVKFLTRRYGEWEAITGGALGFDQAIARACFVEGIKYTIIEPHEGHGGHWPYEARFRYIGIRGRASEVVTLPGAYAVEKLQTRNEEMVKRSQILVALWDGSKSGTGNCVRYAENISGLFEADREIVVIWDQWKKFKAQRNIR